MTPCEMQRALYRHHIQRYDTLATNVHVGNNELDMLGIRRSKYCDEIEIKTSRSDFLADFKKTCTKRTDGTYSPVPCRSPHGNFRYTTMAFNKHDMIREGRMLCNYFYFYLPEELADDVATLIPAYAGLIIAYRDKFGGVRAREVRKARLLHTSKLSDKREFEILRKMAYRYWHGGHPC